MIALEKCMVELSGTEVVTEMLYGLRLGGMNPSLEQR